MKLKSMAPLIALAVVLSSCGKREVAVAEKPYEVTLGTVSTSIIETGTVGAYRTVEVKPQVTGRLKRLNFDEGDSVVKGELMAIIDPQETQLRVSQNRAQLIGAQSQVDRSSLEITQRKQSAAASLIQAKSRVRQLEAEIETQPALLRADVEVAEANLASNIQDLERLLKSTQPINRASIQASLDEASENLKNTKLELERQKDLEQKGFVSLRDVQTATLNVQVAEARYRSAKESSLKLNAGLDSDIARANEAINTAKAQVKRAKASLFQLKSRREDLINAKAAVSLAEAALKDPALLQKGKLQNAASVMQLKSQLSESERQLGETRVISPIEGIVTKKLLQVGELATGLSTFGSGSTIYKVEDRSRMRVNLAVNEVDVARLVVGMKATVKVDAFNNESFEGRVTKIAPARQETNGQAVQVGTDSVVKYEVEIVLNNTNHKLRSGMSAKCNINVANRKNAVFVPGSYLDKKDDQYYASVVSGASSKPERRKVKVGIITTAKVEILSGLKAGEKLITPEFNGPKRKGFMEGGPN
jgi:HlyD family secretion protein